MKKLIKAIVDWFNEPTRYEFENELEYLSKSVDAVDINHKLKKVALEKGYL
tara:strand:- start:1011 stop:1163 length:153 start_codon:yes stop_codon:yes gene_type:complete